MSNLVRVIRLDGRPLTRAQLTPEGYLDDRPILTCTGIFEYVEDDGSIRREFRPPEEVFSPESLESYRGKPVIITHDAGLIDKDNVSKHQIGTILTNGYRDGDNVRAEIMIHDTDNMKASGLKELSLGYNLDLDETPGVYNGQPYDAVQRNIRINHLALVENARAGDKARLNIDSRDHVSKKGETKPMSNRTNRADGVLTPEELAKAIEEFKIKYHSKDDADPEKPEEEIVKTSPAPDAAGEPKAEAAPPAPTAEEKKPAAPAPKEEEPKEKKPAGMEDQVQAVRSRHEDDEDVQFLCDIIDTLLAQKDFNAASSNTDSIDDIEELKGDSDDEELEDKPADDEDFAEDGDDEECKNCDSDEEEEEEVEDKFDEDDDDDLNFEKDGDDEDGGRPTPGDFDLHPGPNPDLKHLNTDAIDRIVRERVKVGMIGRKLNLDGLEDMPLPVAKKTIIKAVRPNMRLDGRSDSYVDAAYDYAVADINARDVKDTRSQKKQMFNKKATNMDAAETDSAAAARERMKARQAKIGK